MDGIISIFSLTKWLISFSKFIFSIFNFHFHLFLLLIQFFIRIKRYLQIRIQIY